jgi:hypothetical protein
MRRLTNHHRDDHGVATIFVVLAMTAMLVGVAFATDVGRYVLEARSAQNSADATVLAVATDCARTGSPIADYSPYRKADQSITAPTCGGGETSITVTTPISDGLLLKRSAGAVDRSATAKWGTIGTATTLPITIADCEWTPERLEQAVDITLYFGDPKPQSGCSSLSGGFGQLVSSDDCAVTVSASGTVDGKTGSDLQKQVPCITPLPREVLIPVYDSQTCGLQCATQGHGPYPIVGFAMFRVTGYSFNGSNYGGTLDKKCPEEKEHGNNCIRGDFIKFVTSQGSPGPSIDFGTTQVYLSS